MSSGYFSDGGRHQRLAWLEGTTLEILLDGAATDGQLMVARNTMREGSASPVHLHHDEDEMFIVLAGTGLFWFGDEEFRVSDGGVVFLPRNVPHAYRIVSPEADVLTLCTPSGMESFFRSAGHDLSTPPPPGFEVTVDALVRAGIAGGQEILGPPR